MFQFVAQIFLGLLVGAVDNWMMPNGKPTGVITTSLIGLAGSLLATILGRFVFHLDGVMGWVMSLVGTLAALFLYQLMVWRRPAYSANEHFSNFRTK